MALTSHVGVGLSDRTVADSVSFMAYVLYIVTEKYYQSDAHEQRRYAALRFCS